MLNTVTSRMFVCHLRQCIMLNVVEIVASIYVYCLMLFRKFALCLLLKCLKHICRTYKLETQSGMFFTLITLLNYLTLQYFNIERTLETLYLKNLSFTLIYVFIINSSYLQCYYCLCNLNVVKSWYYMIQKPLI